MYKSIEQIPDHVKEFDVEAQERWMLIFNETFYEATEEGLSEEEAEEKAMAKANEFLAELEGAEEEEPEEEPEEEGGEEMVAGGGGGSKKKKKKTWMSFPLDALSLQAGDASSWIQLAKTGEFKHWSGKKLDLSREMFESFSANLTAAGGEVPVNLLHPDLRATQGQTVPATDFRAVGRIVELRFDEDKLEARVVWTDEGRDLVRSGSFRHISPEIALKYRTDDGRQIGPTLVGAALTNRPFLRGMAALAATQQAATIAEEDEMNEKTLALVASKLGVEPGDQTALLTALDERIDAATTVVSAESTLAETRKRVIELEGREAMREATSFVNGLLEDGKIVPAQRETATKLALADLGQAREFFRDAEPVLSFEEKGVPAGGGSRESIPADELDKRARKAMTETDGLTYAAACDKVMADDPNLASAYLGL